MLRIHLFGQLRVLDDDTPIRLVAPPKTVPLFAYLLLHREVPVPRDSVAYALWPDEPEAEARTKVRRHLYHLQRTLPPAAPERPWIISDGDTIRWNAAAEYWLDVAEFERLSRAAESRNEAVALYGGDLLEHVYDDWLFGERERLRALYLATLVELVRQHRADRDFPRAIGYAQQVVQCDTLREDAMRTLIALRYESGDRSGALREYEQFARLLRDELGVEPMPETAALYEAIVRNARIAGAGPGFEQPRPQGKAVVPAALPFVGREAELAQLREAWSRVTHRRGGLALLGGEAGIGKTRLSEELALLVEQQGGRVLRGAATYPEPGPYQPIVEAFRDGLPLLTALDIDPAWLAAIGPLLPELRQRRPGLPSLPLLNPDRERARLFEALGRCVEGLAQPRPILLLLEDLHWAGAATIAFVESLAARASAQPILLLVTYREEETPRVHPLRDFVRKLRAERWALHLALGRLPLQALETLVERLPGTGVATGGLAGHLHRESEGLPLFVSELLAEQLAGPTATPGRPELPAAHVEQQPAPHDAARSGGVRSAIAGRLKRLSAHAFALAEVAAVVGVAFNVDLVREVGGWSEAELLDGLDELLDRQLVREAGSRQRYDYTFAHHLVQETISAGIAAPALQRRHRRTARAMEQLYPGVLDELAGELARHFDRGHEPRRAAGYYLRAACRARDVHADQEALVAASRGLELATDLHARFDLLAVREELEHRQGHRDAQASDLQQLQVLAESLGDDEAICETLRRRIRLERLRGEREAEAAAVAALKARAAASGNSRWQVEALQAEGTYFVLLGQYDAARNKLEMALVLRRSLLDIGGQVECCCQLAEVAMHQGRWADMQALLDQAAAVPAASISLPDRPGAQVNQTLLVQTLRMSSAAVFMQHDFAGAYALGQRMLELCRAIGDREGEADALQRVATAEARLFRIDEARRHYREAGTIFSALGKRQGEAAVLLNGAILAARLGEYIESMQAFHTAEALFEALHDPRGQAAGALNISFTALQQGDYAQSKSAALRALELARSLQNPVYESQALGNLGAAERELGELQAAIGHMEAGIAMLRQLGQPANYAGDLVDLTIAYLRAGKLPDARRASEEMLALLDNSSADAMSQPQSMLWAAARTYRALGDSARAQALLEQAHAALQTKVAEIPDARSQSTFLALIFNRELLAAYQNGAWPEA